MAAKIGILGENTATAAAEVTVYTVPADKAARVRIQYVVENDGSATYYSVYVGSPGSEFTFGKNIAGNAASWTGSTTESSPDPAGSIIHAVAGLQDKSGVLDIDNPANGNEAIIAPLCADYFLSTGDTVRYVINNSVVTDHLIQVIGVEDDA